MFLLLNMFYFSNGLEYLIESIPYVIIFASACD